MSGPVLRALVVLIALHGAVGACRRTIFDVTTNERTVLVPASPRQTEFSIDTGRIDLPTRLGTDKTVDRSTLNLVAVNLNEENPVTVSMSAANSFEPNNFGPIATFSLGPGEERAIEVVQTDPDDALVRATQSTFINIRFDSVSPERGIGEIEFRFTVRVLAHKDTPGTGAGSLLFF